MDGSGSRPMTGAGVVLPIRAFALGKARLAAALDPGDRAVLGRRWADTVADAAGALPVVVVSSDPEVVAWATARGLQVVADPGSLDGAAADGSAALHAFGCVRAVVAHADLPRARSLAALARDATRPIVALVPCHRDDGTTVLSVPLPLDFEFAYGPGSFRRHVAQARARGLGVRVVRDPDLAFDVDVPDDLLALALPEAPVGCAP
jgi:2-phospho-L-lactate guanylyltransferase